MKHCTLVVQGSQAFFSQIPLFLLKKRNTNDSCGFEDGFDPMQTHCKAFALLGAKMSLIAAKKMLQFLDPIAIFYLDYQLCLQAKNLTMRAQKKIKIKKQTVLFHQSLEGRCLKRTCLTA